jgi:hypothetical protein
MIDMKRARNCCKHFALVEVREILPAALDEIATLQQRLAEVERENERLCGALTKISDIRDSIVGMQGFNFSEHAYPLVTALDAAGFEGKGYEISRANLGTLIEHRDLAIKERDELKQECEKFKDAGAMLMRQLGDIATTLGEVGWPSENATTAARACNAIRALIQVRDNARKWQPVIDECRRWWSAGERPHGQYKAWSTATTNVLVQALAKLFADESPAISSALTPAAEGQKEK